MTIGIANQYVGIAFHFHRNRVASGWHSTQFGTAFHGIGIAFHGIGIAFHGIGIAFFSESKKVLEINKLSAIQKL
jgi:hypothetical protein